MASCNGACKVRRDSNPDEKTVKSLVLTITLRTSVRVSVHFIIESRTYLFICSSNASYSPRFNSCFHLPICNHSNANNAFLPRQSTTLSLSFPFYFHFHFPAIHHFRHSHSLHPSPSSSSSSFPSNPPRSLNVHQTETALPPLSLMYGNQ